MENQYHNLGLIVAMGKNREIGYKQDLIWKLKEDLNYFKEVTMNSYIIMGRITYESIPKKLQGRKYIILTRNNEYNVDSEKIIFKNIEETLNFIKKEKNSKFYVIGGGIIYSKFIPYIDKMHITEIDNNFPNADTFFPDFNKSEWDINKGQLQNENDLNYRHTLYLRKTKIMK